jgi:hypothetical protein
MTRIAVVISQELEVRQGRIPLKPPVNGPLETEYASRATFRHNAESHT